MTISTHEKRDDIICQSCGDWCGSIEIDRLTLKGECPHCNAVVTAPTENFTLVRVRGGICYVGEATIGPMSNETSLQVLRQFHDRLDQVTMRQLLPVLVDKHCCPTCGTKLIADDQGNTTADYEARGAQEFANGRIITGRCASCKHYVMIAAHSGSATTWHPNGQEGYVTYKNLLYKKPPTAAIRMAKENGHAFD